MKHAIRTIDLTKVYGKKTAVNAVTLTVEEGELFALLGTNGAGKTTTIKMLTCLSRPTSGDAVVLGDSIVSAPQAVKEKINVSPQETAIARSLSVRENVEFIARIYGSSPQVSRKKADEMLLQFGLTEAFCGALLTNLSAWLSGIWFDLGLVGGWFESLAYLLPFAHAVDATRSAMIGSYESVLPHMWWVIGYAVAVAIIAVIVFRSRMTDDNL